MRFRTFFLFLVVALTGLFALLNWDAFSAPSTLSLVFGTVRAPVGLIMLGVVFVLGAMCLAYLIYVQGTALMDARRCARELQLQRDLVDKAESSRFTELHSFVNDELRKLEQMQADTRAQMIERVQEMEERTRLALRETGESLTSTLGALEDRIEHRRVNGGDGAPH